jgi:hypothetical protein
MVEHVARMGEMRNSKYILVKILKEREPAKNLDVPGRILEWIFWE